MIEELLPNLYRMKITLPNSPLKFLNSYLVKGPERSLIIDTGMNREECLKEMTASLKQLDVDLTKTDFFITHLHADHSGLVGTLATPTSKVYFNHREASIIYQTNRWKDFFYDFYHASGFPDKELRRAIDAHPGRRYGLKKHIDFNILREGSTLEFGGFCFRCLETPGHSPGHLCLYEVAKKVLVCGDHILFKITPNITYWPEMVDSLKQYLSSLDKVYSLEVELLLPGHRSLIHDHRKRIEELRVHHQDRLNEVLSAVEDGGKDAYHIVPYVTWDIDCDSWEDFPPPQKWFAFSETMAHLIYLEQEGKIRRENRDNKITFTLN